MKNQLFLFSLVTVLMSHFVVNAAEVKVAVQPSELPDAIRQSIENKCPNGKPVDIQKEVDGERLVQYNIVIRFDDDAVDVEMSPAGEIIEVKKRKKTAASSATKPGLLWTRSFNIEKRTFSTTGRNPFFILEPGYQLILKKNNDKVIMTVLDETKVVDGVKTRILEEREWEDGELAEVSRNFFAVCEKTNDVFYFGEEVDDYKDGKIVGHGGAWQAGKNGAVPGIVMPGTFLLGARYYQEIAEGVAMDRAENVAIGLTVNTPAGRFENCVKVDETSPMESGHSVKLYAPGIGMIDDDGFRLVEVRTGIPLALPLPRASVTK